MCPPGYINGFTSGPSHLLLSIFAVNVSKCFYTAPLQTIYLLAGLDGAFCVAFAFWGQPSLGTFFHNCLISAVWEGLCKLTDLQCRAVATLRLHGYRPFCPCRGASPARTRSGSGRSVRRPFGSETWSCSGTARTGTWTPFRLEIKGEKGGESHLKKRTSI